MPEPPFQSRLVSSIYPLVSFVFLFLVLLNVWVSTPMCSSGPPDVDLPVVPSAALVGRQYDLRLAILEDGRCAVWARPQPCGEVVGWLREHRQGRKSTGVILRADRRLPYRVVHGVAREIRDAGFERLMFETSRRALFGAG